MNIQIVWNTAFGQRVERILQRFVSVDMLFKATELGRSSASSVMFEPGARTAWHTHRLGQAILITAGCGWAQREGGPIEEVHPGKSVCFECRPEALAGATHNTGVSHVAVTEWLDSKAADWLEKIMDGRHMEG